MIPDPNCSCDQCEYYRNQMKKVSKMDIKYATRLMQVYEKLHEGLLNSSDQINDWPICVDPRERQKDFSEYLDTLDHTDPWIKYYKEVSDLLWKLIMIKPPKDSTRVR